MERKDIEYTKNNYQEAFKFNAKRIRELKELVFNCIFDWKQELYHNTKKELMAMYKIWKLEVKISNLRKDISNLEWWINDKKYPKLFKECNHLEIELLELSKTAWIANRWLYPINNGFIQAYLMNPLQAPNWANKKIRKTKVVKKGWKDLVIKKSS